MTNELKAGRELDAIVAEKVMGCKTFNDGVYVFCSDGGKHSDTPAYARHIKHYSSDIAAAWEVVERLKMESRSVDIFTSCCHGPEETVILVDGYERCKGDFSVPHAICLAALKAVGDDGS